MEIAIIIQLIGLSALVLGVGIKLEHRLTKVETDVNWLKNKLLKDCSFNNNSSKQYKLIGKEFENVE